jgi:hypothetical protein
MRRPTPRRKTVSGHRGDEQLIHRSLSSDQDIGRFGRIEPVAPSGNRQLVMKGSPESKETFDGLTERQPKRGRHFAILPCRCRCHLQVVVRTLRLGRIQMLEQARREQVPPFPE